MAQTQYYQSDNLGLLRRSCGRGRVASEGEARALLCVGHPAGEGHVCLGRLCHLQIPGHDGHPQGLRLPQKGLAHHMVRPSLSTTASPADPVPIALLSSCCVQVLSQLNYDDRKANLPHCLHLRRHAELLSGSSTYS